jgi:hypothetical protein
MASTKVVTTIHNNTTLTTGAGTNTSSVVTLDDGYGAGLHIQITNVNTQTTAGQSQIQVSADNTIWYDFGRPLVASLVNGAVTSWGGIEIPIGVEYLRLLTGSNVGASIYVNAQLSEVTAV